MRTRRRDGRKGGYLIEESYFMGKVCMERRCFLRSAALGTASMVLGQQETGARLSDRKHPERRPNLVFIFADQWRAQATGYNGDPNAQTTNLDKLAKESVNMANAVSGCPVCSPYRASLMTGRYPLSHGVFLNDLTLNTKAVSIAQAYNGAGYDTGYIGKWHLNGYHRSAFISREDRQGFDFWKVMECTHSYNNSCYYADENIKLKWEGYDSIAQTREARRYIRAHAEGKPFALFLSWGPPHAPYQTAPQKYKDLIRQEEIKLRPNIPDEFAAVARKDLAGYYAHIAALDDCIGQIVKTLGECGVEENTILVFTSDHGDLLYSQGQKNKQQPYEESIRVPFLLRFPAVLGRVGRKIDMPVNSPDIMPTLLGLSGIKVPDTVEGTDFSAVLRGDQKPCNEAVLISCPSPFGQWSRKQGGREYRGVRTRCYTYVRDLNGPWLLFDNKNDPYQLKNLCHKTEHKDLQANLEKILAKKLQQTNDEFLSGRTYIKRWGYKVSKSGTVSYTN